jgi:hypothetical protein
MTFPHATLSYPEQVFLAGDKLAPGQCFDPRSIDGCRIEQPVEVDQRLAFGEASLTDPVGDPSLATPVGLLADQRS